MHLYPIDGALHLEPEPVDDVVYRFSRGSAGNNEARPELSSGR